jgi:hypothetical protein
MNHSFLEAYQCYGLPPQPGRISRQIHLFFLRAFVDVIYCQAGKCTGPLIYFACVDWLAMTIILRDDDTHSVETGSSITRPFSEGSTKYRYRCRNSAIMMMIITDKEQSDDELPA